MTDACAHSRAAQVAACRPSSTAWLRLRAESSSTASSIPEERRRCPFGAGTRDASTSSMHDPSAADSAPCQPTPFGATPRRLTRFSGPHHVNPQALGATPRQLTRPPVPHHRHLARLSGPSHVDPHASRRHIPSTQASWCRAASSHALAGHACRVMAGLTQSRLTHWSPTTRHQPDHREPAHAGLRPQPASPPADHRLTPTPLAPSRQITRSSSRPIARGRATLPWMRIRAMAEAPLGADARGRPTPADTPLRSPPHPLRP